MQLPNINVWIRKTTVFLSVVCLFVSAILSSSSLFSQGVQPFGKNKVQYENFEWKYIQTKNFTIYYHQGLEYVAKFTGIKIEQAFTHLNSTLGLRLTTGKTLNVIVYGSHNQFQQTNIVSEFLPEGVGGVTELFKNRIVVPFEGDYEKLRHVIHHELVHACLNEMFYNGSLQYALNSRIQIPLWMNEGLAEFASNNGLDINTDMYLRDITINNNIEDLDQLYGFSAYRGGQAFYSFIAQSYGMAKVSELIARLRTTGDAQNTMRTSLGKSLDEVSLQWKKYLQTSYSDDTIRFDAVSKFSQRLTNHVTEGSSYNTSPAISPDGKRVAFISDKDDVFAVFVMDINGENMRKIVSSQRTLDFEELNVTTPGISWDPTSKKLALTAKAGGEDALFLIDIDNDETSKYTFDFRSMSSAKWSFDGKYIALTATVNEQSDIYIFSCETTKLTRLTNDVFKDVHPVWSSDNSSIFFISDRGSHISGNLTKETIKMWNEPLSLSDVYSIDRESRQIQRLTATPRFKKTSLASLPNSSSLFFVSDQNGIGNVYILDLPTKSYKPITNSLSGITQIDISENGSTMVFSAQNNGGYDLFLMNNPATRSIDGDTLPNTRLRSKMFIEENFSLQYSSPPTETQVYQGYGSFDVEFTRSQSVSVNQSVASTGFADGSSRLKVTDIPQISDDFEPKEYRVTVSNDIVLGNPGFSTIWGVQGNLQMLWSDLLGNHQFYTSISLWNDFNNSNLFASYSYLPEIIDLTFTGFQNAFIFREDITTISRFRNYGGGITATYPLDRFSRVEAGVKYLGVSKDNLTDPSRSSFQHNFILQELRYVFDNSTFGFYAPYMGRRWNISFQFSPKLTQNSAAFTTIQTDFRQYIPLYKYLYGLLCRVTAGTSIGANPRNFYLGGTENWINRSFAIATPLFQNPEDFAFLQLPMPLRGYEFSQLGGTNYALVNMEARFQLFPTFISSHIPPILQTITGVAFLDIGTAWSNPDLSNIGRRSPEEVFFNGELRRIYSEGTVMMSTGVGVRSMLLGFPLKVDVAWRNDAGRWSTPIYLFSIGADL